MQRPLHCRQCRPRRAGAVAAPSSTKNAKRERDPEMHQVKKGNQWCFGRKAHTGADRDSKLVHTVVVTAANVAHITKTAALLDVTEKQAHARVGITRQETSRDIFFCAHAISQPGYSCAGRSQRRTVQGQPLGDGRTKSSFPCRRTIDHSGWVCLGTLCVLDNKPREQTPDQLKALRLLARIAIDSSNSGGMRRNHPKRWEVPNSSRSNLRRPGTTFRTLSKLGGGMQVGLSALTESR